MRDGRRRADDDLADRRRLVVDVAELGVQPRMVEGVRAAQADLLLRREDELEPRMAAASFERTARTLDHRRHRRLVVSAEDRARRVAHDSVLDDGLDRPLGRHRVEVRAEEDRRTLRGRLEAHVETSHRRADERARVVLVDLEADASAAPPSLGRRHRAPPPAGSGSPPARGRDRARARGDLRLLASARGRLGRHPQDRAVAPGGRGGARGSAGLPRPGQALRLAEPRPGRRQRWRCGSTATRSR